MSGCREKTMNKRRAGKARPFWLAGTWTALWLIPMVGLLMGASALAHHGWSDYDASRTLTLKGVIKESSYSNPHGMIRLQVDGENGKTWRAVLAPPSRMTTRGLTEEMLKVGTTATVVGYPHKKIADEMRAERITIGEKTVELR
jgi:hypothetical protein